MQRRLWRKFVEGSINFSKIIVVRTQKNIEGNWGVITMTDHHYEYQIDDDTLEKFVARQTTGTRRQLNSINKKLHNPIYRMEPLRLSLPMPPMELERVRQ